MDRLLRDVQVSVYIKFLWPESECIDIHTYKESGVARFSSWLWRAIHPSLVLAERD